jgi:hypothetical protein
MSKHVHTTSPKQFGRNRSLDPDFFSSETVYLDLKVHAAATETHPAATSQAATRCEFSYTLWRWVGGERTLLAENKRDFFLAHSSLKYTDKTALAFLKALSLLVPQYERVTRKFVLGTNCHNFHTIVTERLKDWESKGLFEEQRVGAVWKHLHRLFTSKDTEERASKKVDFSFRITDPRREAQTAAAPTLSST